LKNPEAVTPLGDIKVDNTIDNKFLEAPLVDVAHADCSKDLDPDCQTSVQPLFDKQNSGGKVLARSGAFAKKDTAAIHGFSTQASNKDIASYFSAQAKRAESSAKKQQYKSDQLSSKKASAELLNYFTQEEALAAKPRTPAKHAKSSKAIPHAKEAAPKHGLSGAASRNDFDKYFAVESHAPPPAYVGFSAAAAGADLKQYFAMQELSAVPDEHHPVHGISAAAARADLAGYFATAPQKPQPAAKATPDMIFSRLRDHKRASAAAKAKAAADAAASHRLSSAAAVKDMAAFFQAPAPKASRKAPAAHKAAPKKQALAAYGAGAEDDNAVEVGKAYGVSKTLPGPPVFTANKAPEAKTIDEVNEAIKGQRIDGYTNGNSQPVENVVFPPP